MLDIRPYNSNDEEDRYILLVNDIDERGEHMSLDEVSDAAMTELINQGNSIEESFNILNKLIKDFL